MKEKVKVYYYGLIIKKGERWVTKQIEEKENKKKRTEKRRMIKNGRPDEMDLIKVFIDREKKCNKKKNE